MRTYVNAFIMQRRKVDGNTPNSSISILEANSLPTDDAEAMANFHFAQILPKCLINSFLLSKFNKHEGKIALDR